MSVVWRVGGIALCLLFMSGRTARAQADSTTLHAPGVYSAEQGTRGAEVYRGQCGRCHTVADHSSADFKLAWHGQSVRSLFDYLRGTMPDDDPGALSDQQYLDVTAYLLKVNGMPAGDSPLVADTTALKKLIIEIKAPGGSATPVEQPPSQWRRHLFR
jgi:mono/diheme cytochrome c family protein